MSSTLTRWRSGVYEPNINQRTKVCQFVYVWIEHVTGKLPKMATVQSFSFRFLPFCFHVPRLLPRPERWTLNPQLHLLNEMLPRAWPKFHDCPKVLTPTCLRLGLACCTGIPLMTCTTCTVLNRSKSTQSISWPLSLSGTLCLYDSIYNLDQAWSPWSEASYRDNKWQPCGAVYRYYEGEGLVWKMKVLTFGKS
jgi:hypothetical protein